MRKATCGGLLVLCGFMMACAPPNPGGAGSLAARVDPGSYRCEPGHDKDQSDKHQTRARVSSAGMVHGWSASCEGCLHPLPLHPKLIAPAARHPTGAVGWWGTATFCGAPWVDDGDGLGYFTPGPITGRVSERGLRV